MKDIELQKIVLQTYYDLRARGYFQWINEEVPEDKWPPVESFDQLDRICRQLAEEDLIEWYPAKRGGHGRIKARGVRVIEGAEEPPPGFIVNNIHNSNNVQVGNHNSISQVINVEKLNAAIDHSTFSQVEKVEAKSTLSKFLEHPVIAAIVGGLASNVTKTN
jgi:RIP homotypic interaction motif